MSYLSSGLHLDPEQPAPLAAGLSTFLHSGFFRSLPAFSLTAFPFDTFVLKIFFDEAVYEACTFLLLTLLLSAGRGLLQRTPCFFFCSHSCSGRIAAFL